jgi:hypothetical protein
MAFELETTLPSGVTGNYWYLGFVQVITNDQPYCIVSMDLYLNRQAKLDGKVIMERRNTNMLLSEIDASVSYDFRVCIYHALQQRAEWQSSVYVYDDPEPNPKCQDATVTTQMETSVDISISAYDPYNVPFAISVISQPTNGTIQQNLTEIQFGGGTLSIPVFTYTPNAGYAGSDSFTYTATNDNDVVGNTSTISVTIPSLYPVVVDVSSETFMNNSVDIELEATDPQDLPLTFNLDNPTHGTVSIVDNTVTYVPTTDFVGSDSFEFTADNGTYMSQTATVNVTVNTTVPVASDVTSFTTKDVSVDISGSATDPQGLPLTYSVDTPPANGIVLVNNGIFNYTPNIDYIGSDSFTYKVNNGTQESLPANVSIVVGQ